jgi:hypothetical protein
MFGMNVYVSGSKYDFPICIVNPITTQSVKDSILQFVKQTFESNPQYTKEEVEAIKYAANYKFKYDKSKYAEICYFENLERFFGSLNEMKDFDIVSVAISTEEVGINKNVDSFLLQQKENPEKKCVAIINKNTNQLLKFGF